MRLLLRIAATAVAGTALFVAGSVNAAMELSPSPASGLFVASTVAVSIGLLARALTGTGRGDAEARGSPGLVGPTRAVFLFVAVASLVGLAWLRGIPSPPVHDETAYHNDAIALTECAARTLLRGADPYRELGIFACYDERRIGADRTTPLRRGAFADVPLYPSDDELNAVWSAREREVAACAGCVGASEPAGFEFVWRPSYPSLSVLLILPWVALGWDTNVLYVLCLLAAGLLVLLRATASARPFILTGLLAAVSLTAFTVGGSADLLYALPLVAAWLWRERGWSAALLGISASVKQLAWPFAAFYLIQVGTHHGWREAGRRGALAAAVFGLANGPFVLWDADAWMRGVLTPVVEPMFARGAGLVSLSTGGLLPLLPGAAYLGLEAVAGAAVLALGWRARRTSPELGVVLAMVPLFFAWRSLFSYFFLLPLFAFAGIARMPVGPLSPATARGAGAVTVLAMAPPGGPAAST